MSPCFPWLINHSCACQSGAAPAVLPQPARGAPGCVCAAAVELCYGTWAHSPWGARRAPTAPRQLRAQPWHSTHSWLWNKKLSLNSETTSSPIPGASLVSRLPCASLSLGQGRHPEEWEICGHRRTMCQQHVRIAPEPRHRELQVQHCKGCGSGLSQAQ